MVQRVRSARCSVGDRVVGEIGRGLVSFVGVEPDDTRETTQEAARRIPSLGIFEGDAGNLDRSLEQVGGDLLLVPNFTVCAVFSKEGRPRFDGVAGPDRAETLYEDLVEEVAASVGSVESGRFGAEMNVEVDNDGPVTVPLEV